MALSARVIALQGIGLTPIMLAIQGLFEGETPPPPHTFGGSGGHGNARIRQAFWGPLEYVPLFPGAEEEDQKKKRSRRKRDQELVSALQPVF